MQIRVYYEDTDAGGIVYHSQFLNFCERDRSEKFFSDGRSPLSDDSGFVVSSIEAKYKAPARLGDMLDVHTELISIKNTALLLRQSVSRKDTLLFVMDIKLAYIQNAKIGRLSDKYKEYLKSIFT
ncbi:MAG: acyl-CoA thioester hydrolase [Arcobacter sp.]|nr:MAG: acyl-CoA thioester hydrolase [Arcobacter sp.]